ncbi:MAG: hypothetical protein AABW93_01380 [Nanoarchaeota archaeon]
MNKALMHVIEEWPVLRYLLVVPDLKKTLSLEMITSASAGGFVVARGGEIIDHTNSKPKIPKGKNIRHYSEEIQISEEDIKELEELELSYREKGLNELFYSKAKNLVGRLYEGMRSPDKLKQNRLQVCFGR